MNCEWDNVKNRPQTAEVGFFETELRKPSFRFLNFEVGSVFRKPISEIFIGFRTPLTVQPNNGKQRFIVQLQTTNHVSTTLNDEAKAKSLNCCKCCSI